MILVAALREDAEWAHENEWETPITLGDNLEDAADLIESLSTQLEQVTRERDAAVQDINMLCQCDVCTRLCKYDKPNPYCECADFEWRGVEVTDDAQKRSDAKS